MRISFQPECSNKMANFYPQKNTLQKNLHTYNIKKKCLKRTCPLNYKKNIKTKKYEKNMITFFIILCIKELHVFIWRGKSNFYSITMTCLK